VVEERVIKMLNILLIDDSDFMREIVAEMLEELGHAVRSTPDSGMFRQMALELVPDLLVVDFTLPDIDGPELVQQVRDVKDPAQQNIPVIFISASDPESKLPTDSGWLRKPFTPAEMAAAIHTLIPGADKKVPG
jgi:CheY-like chemotaxis protein